MVQQRLVTRLSSNLFFSRLTSSFLFSISLLVLFSSANSFGAEVAYAGFAYSGDNQSIATRFPYSKKFEAALGQTGLSGLLRKSLETVQPKNFTLVPRFDTLAGRDQAIAVALVMTDEVVSVEQVGDVYKVFVQLRGQALFFDFKSKTIVRAYPFSFAYLDATSSAPTEKQKEIDIGYVYQGKNGKAGIIDRFVQAITTANLPTNVSRFVQVKTVVIGNEAKTSFPARYENGVAETWVADTFGEAIASKMGVPILPFAKGYAIGNVMSMTIADGSIFNLKLPEPDYEFTINVSKLRKIVFEEQAAGKSLIYGTYASLKLEEPMSGQIYIDGQFKNGEVKVVSALQTNTEDFPAFQDSMRGMFIKLAGEIAGDSTPWLKSASINGDLSNQISTTRELLKSCK